ncbi:ribonuclease 2-like [Zingiber officinale]|uniref:ribonuclease 2-like n=1 Tax=Zingiber officinale TaxID=94328 RepID=UPI001C4C0633|nr:ribonuclease 2-like [Zingiber officinale]
MASLLRSLASAVLLALLAVRGIEGTEQREFDYFLLSLLWPGTSCAATRHCCSDNACCRSSPLPEFTIHGLWVDYNDGTWPACCTHSNFDIKKITSLLPTLEKYWPTLSCSSSSLCFGGKGLFWAHEWEKHGTCSYPIIQDEYSYFSKALDLYFKHNMTEVLTNAGILATDDKKYPLKDLAAIITRAFGATPQLVCRHGALDELRLCFYKDFKPRDCVDGADVLANKQNNCPKYVSLPTYTPGLTDISESIGLAMYNPLSVA